MPENFRRVGRKLIAIARPSQGSTSAGNLAGELMNGVEHSAPASAGGQMYQRVEDTAQALHKSGLAIVRGGRIHRPINQEWATHDRAAVHKSPITAIQAMIAIIAHREIASRRIHQLVSSHIFLKLHRPRRLNWRTV